jgi:hypothetical protein
MTREEALQILDTIPTISEQVDALEMAIQALSQEPCRDMEEIAEIMKCDADAETKCKMISNILTAKPHYFEKQTIQDKQAESEKYQKAFDDGYANGYAQARFDYEQEPCDDAISREAVIEWLENATYEDICEAVGTNLDFLPSVTQKSGKWTKMFLTDTRDIYCQCSECGFIHKFIDGHTAQYNFCPNCGARMESEVNNG